VQSGARRYTIHAFEDSRAKLRAATHPGLNPSQRSNADAVARNLFGTSAAANAIKSAHLKAAASPAAKRKKKIGVRPRVPPSSDNA
jgi:hypothetical protein